MDKERRLEYLQKIFDYLSEIPINIPLSLNYASELEEKALLLIDLLEYEDTEILGNLYPKGMDRVPVKLLCKWCTFNRFLSVLYFSHTQKDIKKNFSFTVQKLRNYYNDIIKLEQRRN